jgi:hypothetical protein
MKLTTLTLAAILLSTAAMAQPVTSPSGVVLADDLARPDTWRFHERERSCDPNMWQEPVGHNVWMNVTCETLTNSSKESRRERRAARDAAEQAREDAANQPPIEAPMPEAPAEPTPPVDDTPPVADPTPPADEPAPDAGSDTPPAGNASANNNRGGNYEHTGHTDNGKGRGRG